MDERINILHITDFHAKEKQKDEQRIILTAFLKNVEKLCSHDLKPNAIVFSGDLAFDADEIGIYDKIYDRLISPLLDITGCEDTIFIAPGNHDVQRTSVKQNILVYEALTQKTTANLINGVSDNVDVKEIVGRSFRNYLSAAKGLQSKFLLSENLLGESHFVPHLQTAFVIINSAWVSRGGYEKFNDFEKLIFPETLFLNLIENLPTAPFNVLVSHHPFDWFSRDCRNSLEAIASRKFDLHFCGHMHEARPNFATSVDGQLLTVQSGALFTSRDFFNGYSVVSSSPQTKYLRVKLQTYFPRRREFDSAIDICEGGTFYPSIAAKQFWNSFQPSFPLVQFKKWLGTDVFSSLRELMNDGLAAKPISDVFVDPPITIVTSGDEISSRNNDLDDVEKPINITEIINSSENFMIFADREYGKTTLLQQIALRTVSPAADLIHKQLPIMINFSEIKIGADRLLRILKAQTPNEIPKGLTFERILTEGHALIIVDDVDQSKNRIYDELRQFVRKYPSNRYIFSTRRDIHEAAGALPAADVPVPFKNVVLRPFSRNKLRKLVEKWGGIKNGSTEALLDRLVSDMVHINIPFTAVSGTILLTIFDGQKDASPINRATLIELFVDILLEKSGSEDVMRSRFDFTFKTHFLAKFASHMVYKDQYWLSYADVINFVSKYFNDIGINSQPHEWVQQFLKAKIFTEKNNEISFRYRAFCEYFIALHMDQAVEFRKYILSEERYLSFINEIEYYSARRRDDTQIIELLADRLERLRVGIHKDISWTPNLTLLEKMKRPRRDSDDGMFRSIEREIQLPRLSDEERDSLLEKNIPSNVGVDQNIHKNFYQDESECWSACLILYSKVLKNSELLSSTHKITHLTNIFQGWAELSFLTLIVVPILAKYRKANINGIRYVILAPRNMSDEDVAERIYLGIPRTISRMIATTLGSEKLENQLKVPLIPNKYASEPLIIRMLKDLLYSDLMLPGFSKKLEELDKDLRKSGYLRETLLIKASEMLRLLPLDEQANVRFRKLISAAAVALYSPGSSTSRDLSHRMQNLQRGALLRKLREKANDDRENNIVLEAVIDEGNKDFTQP